MRHELQEPDACCQRELCASGASSRDTRTWPRLSGTRTRVLRDRSRYIHLFFVLIFLYLTQRWKINRDI